MVMDDLTLKSVMDPSSIWTVICMLLNRNKTFRKLNLDIGRPRICRMIGVELEIPGSKDGTELTSEVN